MADGQVRLAGAINDIAARHVILIGAFPPPVGGAAKVNGIVYDALRQSGVDAVSIDTSARALAHSRTPLYHLRRILRNLSALASARHQAKSESLLYIAPDGGAGAWYSCAQVRGAGGKFSRVVVHHHTCLYIRERSRPIALLTDAHRNRSTHVFLTEGMARAFQAQYGAVEAVVASNARFVVAEAAQEAAPRRAGPLRIGHLSNLCRDKGFFEVATTFEAVRKRGIDAELHLAGPVLEPEALIRLDALRAAHGNAVNFVGPVSGDTKIAFYRDIDLFLFPTQWRQEAAPIVTYEAAAAGVPVLATDRGLMTEIVPRERGEVCPANEDFTGFALERIAAFSLVSEDCDARTAAVKKSIRCDCSRAVDQWNALITMLGGAAGAAIGSS